MTLDPSAGSGPTRTNEDWLLELRSGGAVQASALEAMRRYLLRSLPAALARSYYGLQSRGVAI